MWKLKTLNDIWQELSYAYPMKYVPYVSYVYVLLNILYRRGLYILRRPVVPSFQ